MSHDQCQCSTSRAMNAVSILYEDTTILIVTPSSQSMTTSKSPARRRRANRDKQITCHVSELPNKDPNSGLIAISPGSTTLSILTNLGLRSRSSILRASWPRIGNHLHHPRPQLNFTSCLQNHDFEYSRNVYPELMLRLNLELLAPTPGWLHVG